MDFEKLGAFYLGKELDKEKGELSQTPLLYDARDLTTHALCVGMTGSGKTGLCLSLLEEAAIDGVPAIAIDPKGDLGNLLLTFPELRGQDFEPWIDAGEAARKGRQVSEQAEVVAQRWQKGLAEWGQDGERITRFREAAEVSIYTPGSDAGLSLSVIKSFNAPPQAVREDGDVFRERIGSTVGSLLALLGIDADPIQSREHILLSNILQHAWQADKDLDLPALIHQIQDPPFERVGVMDLETFYPPKERFGLSMALNNLLASPGFASWMEGEGLDVGKLLWTEEGKPRLTILSIAHLSDAERMFFVTLLLGEVLSWMRGQAGTTSLRALLYMDEVFGYFPPTANPPSKGPMLTLLKQARAFGLGVVLATQNPVDLDYKGLSNCGTWFLGRLQTERDQARVLDGLEGADSGSGFDRGAIEKTLAGLESRVFLMHNVHDEEPTLFHTRWVLSYLRGPLTRTQIRTLMAERKQQAAGAEAAGAKADGVQASGATRAAKRATTPASSAAAQRPVLPSQANESFLVPNSRVPRDGHRLYAPALLAEARLHYIRASDDVDTWHELQILAHLDDDNTHDPWETLQQLEREPDLEDEPEDEARFQDLPSAAADGKRYARWSRDLKNHLYRERGIDLWRCPQLKASSKPGESEGQFRVRLKQLARERRDLELGKLEKKYAPKLQRAEDAILRAQAKVETEKDQYSQLKMQTAVSVGTSILRGLFGRRVRRSSTTAMNRLSRTGKERADIGRARERLSAAQEKLTLLEEQFQSDTEELAQRYDPDLLELEHRPLKPRKSDIEIPRLALVWLPWNVDEDGNQEEGWEG